jgi:hypothetical protein
MQDQSFQLVVFDNFQNVDDSERGRFGQAIEMLSDRAGSATDNIKLIVVGIAEDARSLLGASGSVRRRTVEIGVPRMPDDEIREIFATGFRLLDTSVDRKSLNALVFYSDGFPYFAHLLGLNVARLVRRRDSSRAEDVVDGALKRAAGEVEQTFEPAVRVAFEAGGDVRPRRRILEVLSYSQSRELLANEIIAEYAERYGPVGDASFLHAALGQLIQTKYGTVLARRGPRGRFLYRFRDPRMRPYLRIAHFSRQLSLFT